MKNIAMKDSNEYKKAINAAGVFSIIADPTRCRIITLLSKTPNGMCVYEVADSVGLSHSAASHQLNKMENLKIVKCYRDGQTMCYEIANTSFATDVLKALGIFYK